MTKETTVIQVTGIGPWGTQFSNSLNNQTGTTSGLQQGGLQQGGLQEG